MADIRLNSLTFPGLNDRYIIPNAWDAYPHKSVSGASVSVTDGADDIPVKSAAVAVTLNQPGSGDPTPSNVRPIVTYSNPVLTRVTDDGTDTYTVNVPLAAGAAGAGTIDMATGAATITHVVLTIGTDIPIYTQGSAPYSQFIISQTVFTNNLGNDYLPIKPSGNTALLCDRIKGGNSTPGIFLNTSGAVRVNTSSSYGDVEAMLTDLGNPQFAYELATPLTVSITPADVRTALGDNTFTPDAGTLALTYRRDITLALAELGG